MKKIWLDRIKKLWHRLTRVGKQNSLAEKWVQLYFAKTQINLAIMCKSHEAQHILYAKQIRYHDQVDLLAQLQLEVSQHQLNRLPCYVILSDEFYQLIPLENQAIPDNELRLAAPWRVKHLLDGPVEKKLIDVIPLPPFGAARSRKMHYVVVADQAQLQNILTLFEQCHLTIQALHIQTLTLAQLLNFNLGVEEQGALLYLGTDHCELVFVQNQELYFSRRIAMPSDPNNSATMNQFILELQRSFDYYTGQMLQNTPTHLYCLGSTTLMQDKALWRERLDIDVDILPIPPHWKLPTYGDQQWWTQNAIALAGAEHATT
jgi:Tfp pilus assembly PilM family ATPase